jgi:hypothetical protein
MAQKQRASKGHRGRGSRTGADKRIRSTPIIAGKPAKGHHPVRLPSPRFTLLPERSKSAAIRAINVIGDMRRGKTFSEAIENRQISARTVKKYVGSLLQQEKPGAHITAASSDRRHFIMAIPNVKKEYVEVSTSSSKERELIGEWLAAMNEARLGDLNRLDAFHKGYPSLFIGGVRIPGPNESRRILELWSEAGLPFETPYKRVARVTA